MAREHSPLEVIPADLAGLVARERIWFVIGGHAVRCFCAYRPSEDVDFGVTTAKDLATLLRRLRKRATVSVIEQTADTLHAQVNDTDVSIFVLPKLKKYTEGRALTVSGILATKLHAILDRGTRRDFFDLYVMMERESLGLVDCFRAIREVYATPVNEGLLLRAITYFDDAEAEAKLPGEGPADWKRVKAFFVTGAGALLTPPSTPLAIQARRVGVHAMPGAPEKRTRPGSARTRGGKRRKRRQRTDR